VFPNHYHALKQAAAIGSVAPGAAIGVAGKDRASYLQGLLTNDIQALTGGTGCYAAWLTPQGRMLSDMHVFESGDMILLVVPEALRAATLERLDQFLFGEDVQLADLSSSLKAVWVHGPLAASTIERVVQGTTALSEWRDYQNARATFDGSPVVIARVDQLGVPGFCLHVEPAREAALRGRSNLPARLSPVTARSRPRGLKRLSDLRHRHDRRHDPLEAGIEQRAISFTKGCYVGQEVIIRVLHRGHGRVARKLVPLIIDGGVPGHDAKIFAGDREIGFVTSGATSPRFGAIALGYVHRDFVAPDTRVEVDTPPGRSAARVSQSPLSAAQ
jgi:folate-binding protein YgfZ